MSDSIDVERDLFGHIAAAHLRTGNRLRMEKRSNGILLHARIMEDMNYGVFQGCHPEPEIIYATARDTVQHFLDIHKRHRIPLEDVMFSGPSADGSFAVTWRHLRVRLPTLRWVLRDEGTVIAGILEEAEEL